jgi:hypothetical protein
MIASIGAICATSSISSTNLRWAGEGASIDTTIANGRRPFKMTLTKLRLAQASIGKPETKVGDLCSELGIIRQTLYRFGDLKGELRIDGEWLLKRRART